MRAERPIRKILLIRTDRMGDLLMTLPAVRCIRRELPGCDVTLLVQDGMQALLQGYPDAVRVLTWDRDLADHWTNAGMLARWMRSFSFDAVVVFNPMKLFHAAAFLAGIPVRVGYRRKWGFFLNRSIPDSKHLRGLHESEYNLELARLLGIDAKEAVLSLPPFRDAEFQAERIFRSNGLDPSQGVVALHPWTSNPAKAWPRESFAALARRLQEQRTQVLLVGEPRAAPDSAWLASFGARVVNLTGRVPLGVLPSLLRRCAMLVSNDSGPVHVAAAVGTPSVVICPKSHEPLIRRWRPLGQGHRVLFDPSVEDVLSALHAPCGS